MGRLAEVSWLLLIVLVIFSGAFVSGSPSPARKTEGKKDHCNKTVDIYEDVSSPEVSPENFGKPLTCWYRFRSFRGTPKDWILRIKFNKFKVGSLLNASHCQGGYMQVSSKRTFKLSPLVNFEECFAQVGLDGNSIRQAFNRNYMLPEANLQIVQYLDCTWTRLGYLAENGNFNYMKIKMWAKSMFVNNLSMPYQTKTDIDNVENKVDFSLVFCDFRKRNGSVYNAIKMYNCLVEHMMIFANLDIDD